ncbi:hypothetical protein DL98DRAFT_599944 [Cadophora sp. DSE1049]|nr:hypothetical protein DL98DRAFT_599944 [Cadophora sp. DSE1049]
MEAVDDRNWDIVLKQTYHELQETIKNRKNIKLSNEDIEAQLLGKLWERFTDLETLSTQLIPLYL